MKRESIESIRSVLSIPGDYLMSAGENVVDIWPVNQLSDTDDLRERFVALRAQAERDRSSDVPSD